MAKQRTLVLLVLCGLLVTACQIGGMLDSLIKGEEAVPPLKPTLKVEKDPPGEVAGDSPIQEDVAERASNLPYYFIAVHNEPYNYPSPRKENSISEAYQILSEMVAYADQYDIKLTLMFSPNWVDHILSDVQHQAQVMGWKANGHELSTHHHSIYHGNWDGYTDQPLEIAFEQRKAQGKQSPEQHFGSMNDLLDVLHRLDPGIQSGCLNDEQDKADLPDGIIYDTCSGIANKGEAGTLLEGSDPNKGINEYVLTGTIDGIQRRWLSHAATGSQQAVSAAEVVFRTLDGSVIYGTIFHSFEDQARAFYTYADFLHNLDPQGAKSLTLTEAIESGILPEVALDEVTLREGGNERPQVMSTGKKCGDGICDPLEQKDAALCPLDCG